MRRDRGQSRAADLNGDLVIRKRIAQSAVFARDAYTGMYFSWPGASLWDISSDHPNGFARHTGWSSLDAGDLQVVDAALGGGVAGGTQLAPVVAVNVQARPHKLLLSALQACRYWLPGEKNVRESNTVFTCFKVSK